MTTIKNKGIRTPINDSNQVELAISGFSVETNDKNAPEIDKSQDCSYTVHFILEGKGYALIDEVKHPLVKNTLFVSFPQANVKLRQDENEPYKLAWFIMDGLKAKYWLERIGITKRSPILQIPENKLIRNIFARTPYICSKNTDLSDLYALNAVYSLFYNIALLSQQALIKQNGKGTEEIHVAHAIEYINSHYADERCTLEVVAKELYITSKYLSFIFKKITGNTFSHYLQAKRIAVANTLMEQGETRIHVIAEKTGFASPYYFSNVYRKHNAISPRTHIKDLQRKKSPPPTES